MTMETQRYGEFSRRFHERVLRERIPVEGVIEVTRRCPLTCAHCYNNLPMGDAEARRNELSYEEHCRILDEITEAGCLWLLYTGGEIFARRDFLDIYTYAKQKGLLITLFTNGTLITEKVADYLAEWRPFAIEITLYGRTRETYERLTGIPGSYRRCLQGIQLLLERGLPLRLKTVAVTLNIHELWEMKRFVEDELGLEFKFDAMINPRIDCSRSPLAVRLTPEEIVALDVCDPDRAGEWKRFFQHGEMSLSAATTHHLYHCGGGVTSFAIDPYGRMSICVLSHADMYDLRRGSFREGWQEFLQKVRQKEITRMTKCVLCPLKPICGMCPANGELESGHPEKPVDFLCQVAHLRAYVFGVPVSPHGDCDYCDGGSGYHTLRQTAEKVLQQAQSRRRFLPVVSASRLGSSGGCVGAGCSSCHFATFREGLA